MSFILFLITYYLNQFLKLSANIVTPVFQNRFSLSNAISGLISSLFFLSYGIMQIVSGPICKKTGPEKLVGLGMICCGFGVTSLGFANGVFGILLGRLLMGFGLGSVFVCIFFYMTEHYLGKNYVTASAVALAVSSLGTATSSAPLKAAINRFGITYTFSALALICFAVATMLLFYSKKHVIKKTDTQISLIKQIRNTTVYIFKNKELVLGMFIWILFIGLQMTYAGLWCTKWTQAAFPDKESLSGLPGTVFGFSLMCGCFFGKYLKTEKMSFKTSSIIHSWILCFSVTALCLVNITGPFFLCLVTNLLFGFFCGTVSVHDSAFCRAFSSAEENASVMGIWNFLASMVVIFFQWGSGILIDLLSNLTYPYSWTHLILAGVFVLFLLFKRK